VAGPPEEVQVRANIGVSAVSAVVSENCISSMFTPPVYEEQEWFKEQPGIHAVFQLKCTTNYTTLFASYVENKCSRTPVIYREHVAPRIVVM